MSTVACAQFLPPLLLDHTSSKCVREFPNPPNMTSCPIEVCTRPNSIRPSHSACAVSCFQEGCWSELQVHSQTSFNICSLSPSPPIMTRLVLLVARACMLQRAVQGGSIGPDHVIPLSVLVQTSLQVSLGDPDADPPNRINPLPSATNPKRCRFEKSAELVCCVNAIVLMSAAHTSFVAPFPSATPPAKIICVDVLASPNILR